MPRAAGSLASYPLASHQLVKSQWTARASLTRSATTCWDGQSASSEASSSTHLLSFVIVAIRRVLVDPSPKLFSAQTHVRRCCDQMLKERAAAFFIILWTLSRGANFMVDASLCLVALQHVFSTARSYRLGQHHQVLRGPQYGLRVWESYSVLDG
jgi:hypothetical protein